MKVLTTYAVSVLVVTFIILWWGSFPGGMRSLNLREMELGLKVSAVFSLPVFVLIGLPYMGLGYRAWGREHTWPFVVVGAALGALGGGAFGALLAMPQSVPPIMIFIGGAAGLAASSCWVFVSGRIDEGNA